MRPYDKRKDVGQVGALEQSGVLDESLRRELTAENRRGIEGKGLDLLKRRDLGLPLPSLIRSH